MHTSGAARNSKRESDVVPAHVRQLTFATSDPALRREVLRCAANRSDSITIVSDPDVLRAWVRGRPGTVVVDARCPGLVSAVDPRGTVSIDRHSFLIRACHEASHETRTMAVTCEMRSAVEIAVELAPERAADAADTILGVSVAAHQLRDETRTMAGFVEINALILGETGTGKELIARSMHDLEFAADRPFIAVNCAALPDHLVESELFGHEAGAFTGAQGRRVGLLEAAENGTIFLDEIGDMPLESQTALLRALESRSIRPVGSNREVPFAARVIAATNRNTRADRGRLRRDLYYRLAGVTIAAPPLRDRADDVPFLALRFLRGFAARNGLASADINDAALDLLDRQPWYGNVRELHAVTGHAAILAGGKPLGLMHVTAALATRLDMATTHPPPAPRREEPITGTRLTPLAAAERRLIVRAMEECGGNVARAARILDVPRSTFRDKLSRYGIG